MLNFLRCKRAKSCKHFKTLSTRNVFPSIKYFFSSITANDAPRVKALLAYKLPLKLGPFKAKKMSFLQMFLESVVIC